MPFSEDYTFKLQTKEIYTILTEYFDLNCDNKIPYYIFPTQEAFILSADDEEFVVGTLESPYLGKENIMMNNL